MRLGFLELALALSSLGMLVACGDEELTAIDFGPAGEPSIRFADPASSAGEPVCVEVPTETDYRLPMLIETDELKLRPPGTCGIYGQCGSLQLFADGVLNNEGAVRAIELLLRKVPDRYHDGSPRADTGEPDVLRVTVKVVDVNEDPVVSHDGEPLVDEIELLTVPSCGELP